MLVLSRRQQESIVIGDNVVVKVLEMRGDAVRLGITAPASVQVHRQEVFEAIRDANRQASGPIDEAGLAGIGARLRTGSAGGERGSDAEPGS